VLENRVGLDVVVGQPSMDKAVRHEEDVRAEYYKESA
jgi:hypothetical protein